MTVLFCSDTHFGHKRICEYAKRPFASLQEHDETLIENWNRAVAPGDLVYFLGDFSLGDQDEACRIAGRLNGTKHIIWGNHDRALRRNLKFLRHWDWNGDMKHVEVEGQRVTLCHYAMRVWPHSHHGAWNLFGHSHGSLTVDTHSLQIDVGVDCWGYTPVSFAALQEHMATRTWKPVDQHGNRDFEKRGEPEQ